MENTQSDLKNRLEALLFSSGKPMQIEELSRITKEKDLERIKKALQELKQDLEHKKSSMMLINDGNEWKLTVREHYMPFVRKVVSKTELPKTILQTLAVVAYKAPALQSQIIKIRTNKAYKHLEFLEEKGYITREKKGRTKLIKLTQKFFEYFDLPPEKLKQKFEGFKEFEKAIEQKEKALEKKTGKVEIYDTIETYDLKERKPEEAHKEMLNGLKIYTANKEQSLEKSGPKIEQKIEKVEQEAEAIQEAIEEKLQPKKEIKKEKHTSDKNQKTKKSRPKKKYKSKGMFPKGIPAKIQEKVDERVQEIVEGEKQENDDNTKMPEMQEQDEVPKQK